MKSLALLSLFLPAAAFAMPCDTGYTCTSATGRYVIEIQHCRYDNHLGNIAILKIAGQDLTEKATLGPAWDGDALGGFEIQLPDQGDHQRILSVEWLKSTGKGTLRDKSRNDNPAPFQTDRAEKITCVNED